MRINTQKRTFAAHLQGSFAHRNLTEALRDVKVFQNAGRTTTVSVNDPLLFNRSRTVEITARGISILYPTGKTVTLSNQQAKQLIVQLDSRYREMQLREAHSYYPSVNGEFAAAVDSSLKGIARQMKTNGIGWPLEVYKLRQRKRA